MKNFLKSREQVILERTGAVCESVFKIGDVYKVKPIVDVPKSLINAFISKAKKEQDVDPREMWSDTDIAELIVSYVTKTFLNIDSIPVSAIMGEKSTGDSAVASTEVQPVAQTPVQPAATPQEQPIVQPTTQEETKIAAIPTELQLEAKKKLNENFASDEAIDSIARTVKTILAQRGLELTQHNIHKILNETEDGNSIANDENLDSGDFVKIENTLLKSDETKIAEPTEDVETFYVNMELTDEVRENLKENKISFDKSSGILEIKATKTQFEAFKKSL